MVPTADLAGANAARAVVGMGAVAAGPVVGSVLLLLGSPSTAFLVNAATFAVSGLAVLDDRPGPGVPPGPGHR